MLLWDEMWGQEKINQLLNCVMLLLMHWGL